MCINEGTFTDICIDNGTIYVASSDTHNSPIQTYTLRGPADEKESWIRTHDLETPCRGSHHHTIRFNERVAIMACRDTNTVYKMKKYDLEVVESYCSSDDQGAVDFVAPYICQV